MSKSQTSGNVKRFIGLLVFLSLVLARGAQAEHDLRIRSSDTPFTESPPLHELSFRPCYGPRAYCAVYASPLSQQFGNNIGGAASEISYSPSHYCFVQRVFASLFFVICPLAAETPAGADAFVNSVGVNVHLSYADSVYYQKFPIILQALQDLHIRHVRDGIADYGSGPYFYYSNHNSLAQVGIRCNYIVGPGIPQSTVAAYPSRVQDMESLEAVNEIDNSGDPNWAADMKAQLKWLFPLADSLNMPFAGPSLVNSSSYSALGNISQGMNFNNLHNYFAGFSPETNGWGACDKQGHCYGSIAWNLDNTTIDGPNVPVWTTETGYDVNTNEISSIPPTVYGTYISRLLFAQWNAGIQRTFIYELADDPTTTPSSFGLMDNQGTRRPAFTALSNLLNLLQDPGPPFTPTAPFVYSLSGDTSNVEHTLLQKRDGTIYLALWIAEPVYDPNAKASLAVSPQAVTVTVPSSITSAGLYAYDQNWNLQAQSLSINADQVAVNVTSKVSLLKLSSAGSASSGTMPVNQWVQIISRNSGKCLDIDGGPSATAAGDFLDQLDCSGGTNQAFQLNPVPGGYEVTAESSELQLNVAGGPSVKQNGTHVIQEPYWGGTNQVWKLTLTSGGYYMMSVQSSGGCLDITGESKADGAVAQQWACWGGNNQQWKFVPVQ